MADYRILGTQQQEIGDFCGLDLLNNWLQVLYFEHEKSAENSFRNKLRRPRI